MLKKKLSVGLILVLMLGLGGCQTEGMTKNVVYSKEQKAANGLENVGQYPIQQAEAVEKAEAAFRQYLNIQTIDKSLILKAALIENDAIRWMNPYWKLSWVQKDGEKPVYSAQIDAQTGKTVQLRYRPKMGHKTISREDVLRYQDTALAFIDKFDLVKDAPLSMFEASSSYMEGIFLEFRYGTDKFIEIDINEAGDVAGFQFSQRSAYTLQGSDLKVNRTEAINKAQTYINQYYGEVDTGNMIEQIQLVEGRQGEKTWFVYWKNIAMLEGRYTRYGAQIDALTGNLYAVEGTDHVLANNAPDLDKEKLREIADRFLQHKNLSDYRFVKFDQDLGSVLYRNQKGEPLHVFADHGNGKVNFLSFTEFK